jgi:Zn-dependent peptidase ImmA (M78 family)
MPDNVDYSKPRTGLARNLARNLLKKAGINSYPILIKEVARQIPELYIDGQEMEDGISGLKATYKGASFIRYNLRHSIKRNRFTVAHEIGHILLGHSDNDPVFSLGSKNPKEIEANQFAAELLTPLAMLKDAVCECKTVSKLSTAFWVSKEEMNWRILETNLYSCLEAWD